MEYTVQQLDEWCSRIERLAEQIAQAPASLGPRSDDVANDVVQTIQRIGESIAWAYGQHLQVGEQFAQPFVDRHIPKVFRDLLTERTSIQRDPKNRIAAQILQTIHILLQSTPLDSTLVCSLTSGWYLNKIICAQYDFREHEDLLPLWMTMVKDLAKMLDKDNIMLFYDPMDVNKFPIFSEAIRFYHHPGSQIRTQVQAICLEIFLKLRDEPTTEPLFRTVVTESLLFCTHVCCLLRDFWKMADEAVRTGARRDIRSALYIQNDILMFVNDVFFSGIPEVSAAMQEKLLHFAVLPVLLRSIMRPRGPANLAGAPPPPDERGLLSPTTAWYLLHDMLVTLRSSPVFTALAALVLRARVPEEILLLVRDPPPRTPAQYFSQQAAWGGATLPDVFDCSDGTAMPDEALYAMPRVPIVKLERGGDSGRFVQNRLFDALEGQLLGFATGGELAGMAIAVLGATAALLQTQSSTQEALEGKVAERLSFALCEVLVFHHQFRWSTIEGALAALGELAAAADVPPGRARLILGPPLRDRVLVPLATELLEDMRKLSGSAQEQWLTEFQEQWAAHQGPAPSPSAAYRRELLEQGPTAAAAMEAPGAPEGSARDIRVLLGVRRLALVLVGAASAVGTPFQRMPCSDDKEIEESSRYKPGVPVHIGKMNRVKCQVRCAGRRRSELESLYVLPMQATLVLARPDEQKPFWAVPVISEPLRCVRLTSCDENSGPSAGHQQTLQLEVAAPRSPFINAATSPSAFPMGMNLPAMQDRMAHSYASPQQPMDCMAHTAQAGAAAFALPHDRMANSAPMMPSHGLVPDLSQGPEVPTLTLVFADERRRRVVCKILMQQRHIVLQRMSEGLATLLAEIRGGMI